MNVQERFVVFAGPAPDRVGAKQQAHRPAADQRDQRQSDALNQRAKPGPGDFIACADGGYELCVRAGLKPAVVMGDFDSLPEGQIPEIKSRGIECLAYPREKDETDTLLCCKYGLARGFRRFLIVGGIGGDLGHTVANLQVLSFLTDMECEAEIMTANERLFMADGETLPVRGTARPSVPAVFCGTPGARFSVFSYAERSSGVCIKNAKYSLSDAVLTQSYPVGVSNEFINKEPVTVSVRYGRLLIITQV